MLLKVIRNGQAVTPLDQIRGDLYSCQRDLIITRAIVM